MNKKTDKLALLSIEDFKEKVKAGYRIIDFRDADRFTEAFIPGSVSVVYRESPSFWRDLEVMLLKDQGFIFIADEECQTEIHEVLKKEGYRNIIGALKGGFSSWEAESENMDMIIVASNEELGIDLKHDESIRLIDIRSNDLYEKAHLEKAENWPVESIINGGWEELKTGKTHYVYCEDGFSSLSLISWLKCNKRHNFYLLSGGFRQISDSPDVAKSRRS